MNKKIIILNGAPSSGKDTIAGYLRDRLNFTQMEVKSELFDIATMLSGISSVDWFNRYDDRENNLKEVSWDRLGGLSQREFLIKISEDWMKPVFGKDVFAKKLRDRIKSSDGKEFVISDSGFQKEVDILVDEFGEENVYLARLHRDGCAFSNDSRGYLNHKYELDFNNNKHPPNTAQMILVEYEKTVYRKRALWENQ